MTVFSGSEGIKQFLEVLDGWLSKSVDVYLLSGSAMTIRNLKDQTEDIDLALGAVSEFEYVYRTLSEQGFEVTDEPTESFESVGKRSSSITPVLVFVSTSLISRWSERCGSPNGFANGRRRSGQAAMSLHSSYRMRICSC